MGTVLVVEDNDGVREMMSITLQLEGHHTITASNGRQALDLLSGGVIPCLILLDLRMPVMDGFAFREALQQDPRLRGVPIVVVSATTGEDIARLQPMAVLDKPINVDRLLDVVEECCQRERAAVGNTASARPVSVRRER